MKFCRKIKLGSRRCISGLGSTFTEGYSGSVVGGWRTGKWAPWSNSGNHQSFACNNAPDGSRILTAVGTGVSGTNKPKTWWADARWSTSQGAYWYGYPKES